jgi:hypothetical protein
MSAVSPAATADRSAGFGVLTAACVPTLVVNAHTSAVTILLPAISKDLDPPLSQLQWAVTGYMLVGAAVIVTSGALGAYSAGGGSFWPGWRCSSLRPCLSHWRRAALA